MAIGRCRCGDARRQEARGEKPGENYGDTTDHEHVPTVSDDFLRVTFGEWRARSHATAPGAAANGPAAPPYRRIGTAPAARPARSLPRYRAPAKPAPVPIVNQGTIAALFGPGLGVPQHIWGFSALRTGSPAAQMGCHPCRNQCRRTLIPV
ncbi:hypothetical protein HOK021_42960 [Streptomyces hygroscopicus]|nr:hypothetical protein HOK021_42960 [Streptomyces hygroscopicus]